MTNADGSDHLRTAYDQLCTSYHAIDDFRAKLLGFLPLVTGGGLILLTGRPDDLRKEFFGPVGLLGIAVTLGLLAYELAGIKRCLALIDDGLALETDMNLQRGQFIRDDYAFRFITKSFAAAWIYPAVLAAWSYLALFINHRVLADVISPIVFVAGFVGILVYDQSLRKKAEARASATPNPSAPQRPRWMSTPAPVERRLNAEGVNRLGRSWALRVSLTTSRGLRAGSRASGT
jgi:hypothetical protein